jgi:hypothetical protein
MYDGKQFKWPCIIDRTLLNITYIIRSRKSNIDRQYKCQNWTKRPNNNVQNTTQKT